MRREKISSRAKMNDKNLGHEEKEDIIKDEGE
jgi:hypothetical protein